MSAPVPIPEANVRSQTYFIARATAQCSHCGSPTCLVALAMPRMHETLDADTSDDGDGGGFGQDEWQSTDAHAFLFYVEQVPDDVQHRLQELSQDFRLAHSAATQNFYWANHCGHCGTLLDDHELHCEPDGAFAPSDEDAAAAIELLQVVAPLRAAASGYTLEPEFFRFMRRS